ncbi:hypothetical protein NG895_17725 [Aeoliella sp. ICT_H6.2]|uniref:Uncharacterized protein n=1 Tax=Aeoliella straminimaris TaxID=2954799 RepID=A0A9X2FBB5_9BACT|nr:hypothetical protein [Aeoliella straminimaris]MCO6045740.1 hypothetical protein [Aeoliella straminimaris]
MDDAKLIEIAETLETENDLSDARSRVARGHPPNYVFPLANRAGYIRLAAWFLRAAALPSKAVEGAKQVFIDESLQQILLDKNDLHIDFLGRDEDLPGPSVSPSVVREGLGTFVSFAVWALGIIIFVLGVRSLLQILGLLVGP